MNNDLRKEFENIMADYDNIFSDLNAQMAEPLDKSMLQYMHDMFDNIGSRLEAIERRL